MIPREILLPESTSKAERAAPQSKSSPRQIMVKILVPFHEQPGKCQDNNQCDSFRGGNANPTSVHQTQFLSLTGSNTSPCLPISKSRGETIHHSLAVVSSVEERGLRTCSDGVGGKLSTAAPSELAVLGL